MLFNSLEFLWFLPVVFTAYWLLNRHLRLQNLMIVIASYVFYGWWDWRFLLLMTFTSVWSYVVGVLEFGRWQNEKGSKALLTISLIVNLGILGVFKYYNFFVDSFLAAANACLPSELVPRISSLNVILPVGISFYTFQALSYTIDVYRRQIVPTKDPVAFFAFISFFPQLVAGPIERATNLLPQFLKPRQFDYVLAVDGCRQMLWGLFKKIVMAETCGKVADSIFANVGNEGGFMLWIGAVLFAFQIYGDFSGYSDVAIGCSRLFGFRLMRNFAFPYFARDIAEFWRRWHISLTTGFRDYLYIPLGGSRCGLTRKIRNTFVIFLVSGFWHGANWTFVIWGFVHACLFLPLLVFGKNRKYLGPVAEGRLLPSLGELFGMILTFVTVVLAWVFFRASDLSAALLYLKGMFATVGSMQMPLRDLTPLMWSAVVMIVEWVNRDGQHGLSILPRARILRWLIYLALVTMCFAYFRRDAAFIYFQF